MSSRAVCPVVSEHGSWNSAAQLRGGPLVAEPKPWTTPPGASKMQKEEDTLQEAGEPPRLVMAKRDGMGRAPEPRSHRAGTHAEGSRRPTQRSPLWVPAHLLSCGVTCAHGCQKETPFPDLGLHQEACECHSYQNPAPPADWQCPTQLEGSPKN